jgi:hypothetical protein
LHLCPKNHLYRWKGYLLVVPNAFTPNDDINDTLRPVTKALKNVRLDIYDTWGCWSIQRQGNFARME